MPKVSVLMPVYNGEKYIKQSLDCILDQTYEDFECIIINDASKDATRNIIENYSDKRIRLLNLEKNHGLASALNFGLQQVQGEYIARADADDIYHVSRLQRQVEFLDQHKDIAIAGTLIEYFPDNAAVEESARYKGFKNEIEVQINQVTTWEELREKMYWSCSLIHSSIMIRKSVMDLFTYEKEFTKCEDYRLFYNMNKKGYKMANLNEVLTKVRVSEQSVTSSNVNQYFLQVYEIKKEEVAKLFKSGKGVYVWGAGGLGQALFDIFTSEGFDIEGFIDGDSSKWGQAIKGKKVYPPKVIYEKGKAAKVIGASQPGRYTIAAYLKESGCRHLDDFVLF